MHPAAPGINPLVALPLDKAGAILRGLADGTLYQDGGVIRRAGTKRLFAFLKSTSEVVDPSSLASLSNLVSLGTAASVLNLGVSVVGFAVIHHKLRQVQDGIRLLDSAVRNGFASVSSRLDSVEARLVGLQLLGLRTHADLGRVEAKVDSVAAQVDVAQFVPLAMALELLAEVRAGTTPDAGWLRAQAERAQAVRLYCLGMLERASPRDLPLSDPRFVALRAYLTVAALAAVTEARCLRMAGDTRIAIGRLEATSTRLLRPNQEVVLQLLDGEPTVLGSRQVESVLGKGQAASVARLLDPETSSDEALRALEERWSVRVGDGDAVAAAKLRSFRDEGDAWRTRAEIARQSTEVHELLATMRAEYEMAEALNLTQEQWDREVRARPTAEVVLLMAGE